MKRFFHKSMGIILFAATVSLVFTLGITLARALNRVDSSFQNSNFIIFVAASLAFLLLLNTVDIVEFWLRGKLQELKVKSIVGISRSNIYVPMYLNLNLLILISFGIGVLLTIGASALMRSVIAFKVEPLDCLLSFGFCVLFLNLFCTLLVPRALRKCGAVKA